MHTLVTDPFIETCNQLPVPNYFSPKKIDWFIIL